MLLKNKLDDMKSFLDSDNVLASLEERYCYAKDASNLNHNYKVPDLVVFVESIDDVQKTMKYAYEHSIPVIARGAGTNMVGACVCTAGGIVLNFSRMNKILDINPINMTARVQPGVVLGDLKIEVEKLNMLYPPDPSNFRVSTLGGSIAQSSAGAMSFKYGTTKDYVLSMKVVTSDGSLIKVGSETSKDSVGYHLAQLIVGSEGTLGIVVEATLKLLPKPEMKKSMIAYFQDANKMIKAVTALTSNGIYPASIDFMDNNSMKTIEDFLKVGLRTDSKYSILLDIDGNKQAVNSDIEKVRTLFELLGEVIVEVPETEYEAEKLWQARQSSFAAATRLAPDVLSDDIIVPKDKLVEIISFCEYVVQKNSLLMCLVGHLGDGNLHPQFVLDLRNEDEFRRYQNVKSEIYSKVKELGGTISAEHGVGLEKKEYFKDVIDAKTFDYMRLIKKTFDPRNILNPGKIFDT